MLLMTNEVNYKIKEKQLKLLSDWIETHPNKKGTRIYAERRELVELLICEIEIFKELAEFDRHIATMGGKAPTVIRLGHLDEYVEDEIARYRRAEMQHPTTPLVQEMIQIFEEVVAEYRYAR